MYEIFERHGIDTQSNVDDGVELSHEQREKGRIKTTSNAGEEVRVFLERGKPLAINELLSSQCGKKIRVLGQIEQVTRATCEDWETFSKACYHLGNRHVKIQVGEKWLRILPDHVLEEMLQQLGLSLVKEHAVFEPESGAYAHAHHDH
ncbi:MAG: urease accessory protein UreE [Agarilytica sp.]